MISTIDESLSLEKCPALVLNADYRPLSYYPLSLWSWQDSIKSVYLDRVSIVSYCGSKSELTFDHLLPRSKGGKTDWDNVVTACSSCNVKKGGRLYENSGMILSQKPFRPSTEDLHRNGKNFPPNFLHKSWMDYLYWDVELEP